MRSRPRSDQHKKRGAVVVYVAISMTVIMGMAALAVDVGRLYVAQSELQRAADAAAMAAAGELSDLTTTGDMLQRTTDAANQIALLNPVAGHDVGVSAGSGVELGSALVDPVSGVTTFQPGAADVATNAVRVTLRRTADSPAGAIQMTFGRFLGLEQRGLEARAAAVLIPRDMAVVIDLSASMDYDSQLRYWDRTDGGYSNLRDIWAAMDGPEPSRPYLPGSELTTEYANDTGPDIGAMSVWGDPLLPGSYDASSDPGLWSIRRWQYTSDAGLLNDLTARGYNDAERAAMINATYDYSWTYFRNRTVVMLGLAEWYSGMPGALHPGFGNGNNRVDSNELSWLPKPDFRIDWSWSWYVYWVQYNSEYAYDKTEFRFKYGLKTFFDFLLDSEPMSTETDGLWATPQQPLRAVKDAVRTLINVVSAQDNLDHISLEIFATTSRHEVNLTSQLAQVSDTLYHRQSGHYDRATNIAGGLAQATAELQSERARPAAAKVIVLMSDGVANTDEDGNWLGDGSQFARQLALDRAQEAADLGFKIFTVSVGYSVDRSLLQEIAAIGGGQEFYAAGSPEEYSEQLELIFRALGGKRPVALIE